MGWISMITAVSALATAQVARRARQARTVAVYVGLVLATSAVVSATGHLGGGLVYGDDYLTGVLPWNQRAEAVPASSAATTLAVPAKASGAAPAPTPSAPVATPTAPAAAPALPPSVPAAKAAAPRRSATAIASHEPQAAPETAASTVTAAQAADAVDFTRDVMPILKHTCVECHGPDKVKARLRMDSVEGLQKGGKSGALVKPGDPENSLMIRRLLGLDGEDQMPLDKDPLTEKQIDTLRRWIAAGANYPAAGSQ
jgi:mono/diheme cytochrome c family protein